MILDDIARETRRRLEQKKKEGYYEAVHEALAHRKPLEGEPFKKNLQAPGLSFICEVKRASPSRGNLVEDFPYLEIAKTYEKAGASAISCLTEPHWFKGSMTYLKEIAEQVSIPVLCKDFVVDPCQIEEAALSGASAILLIAAILTEEQLREYMDLAHSLGLSTLCEAHSEDEVKKLLRAGADIIGINNRNLKDFTIDTGNTERLSRLVPESVILVSESGMMNPETIRRMRQAGADAVLIGEYLMKAENRETLLRTLIKENQ
jgi:indole-3-glycerol phosphate synthase